MNYRTLRGWLMAPPRPASVRLVTEGQQPKQLTRAPDQTWASLASSIDAIEPDAIEVLDANGVLIRAIKPEAFETAADESEPVKQVTAKPTDFDAETVRFRIFADHVAHAYEHGYTVAFARMCDVFEAVNRRSEALEKSLATTERLLRSAYQDSIDKAVELAETQASDPLSTMVAGFVSGQAQGAMDAVATKPTNGKAKAKA
jgi:hypothetical protein